MGEREKGVDTDQHAGDATDYIGSLVKLDIADSARQREETSAEVDDAGGPSGLTEVFRVMEADFRRLTVPLLGRSERVLPARSFFRLRKITARWRDLLFEKTGDTSLFRVSVRLEPSTSAPESRPEPNSELINETSKRERETNRSPDCECWGRARFRPRFAWSISPGSQGAEYLRCD